MARAKVGIVGAGNVGAAAAFILSKRNVCDVLLSDIVEGDKSNDYWGDLVSKYRTWQLAAQVVPV